MLKIEKGLHKIHKIAGAGSQESSSTSNTMQDVFLLEPFLRVNLVSSGSPAELAVSKQSYLLLVTNLLINLKSIFSILSYSYCIYSFEY
jgi:26S proteasome non-ATPase regulatory subunit 9